MVKDGNKKGSTATATKPALGDRFDSIKARASASPKPQPKAAPVRPMFKGSKAAAIPAGVQQRRANASARQNVARQQALANARGTQNRNQNRNQNQNQNNQTNFVTRGGKAKPKRKTPAKPANVAPNQRNPKPKQRAKPKAKAKPKPKVKEVKKTAQDLDDEMKAYMAKARGEDWVKNQLDEELKAYEKGRESALSKKDK